jgi:hypothetical protein
MLILAPVSRSSRIRWLPDAAGLVEARRRVALRDRLPEIAAQFAAGLEFADKRSEGVSAFG